MGGKEVSKGMRSHLSIIKGQGIDDFIRGYKGKVEEENENIVTGENTVPKLCAKYQIFLEMVESGEYMPYLEENVNEILSSAEINHLLQEIDGEEAEKTPAFINHLVWNMYHSGTREFNFDVGKEFSMFLSDMRRTCFPKMYRIDERVKVNYRGDLKEKCFSRIYNMDVFFSGKATSIFKEAYNCHIDVEGEIEMSALAITNCMVSVKGKVGEEFGVKAHGSRFSVDGIIGSRCGLYADSSEFELKGEIGDYCGANADSSSYKIIGNVGDSCGFFTKKCKIYIDGDSGDELGTMAQDLKIVTKGEVGNKAGRLCERCRFTLQDKTGKGLAIDAKESTFNIFGEVDEENLAANAQNCLFRTNNKETLEKLLRSVPFENEIVFIEKGKQRIVRENWSKKPSFPDPYLSNLQKVCQKYEAMIYDKEKPATANLNDIITSQEIEELNRWTAQFSDKEKYEYTGVFMTRLIRNSLHIGQKEFNLVFNKPLMEIGKYVEGHYTIDGSISHVCFIESKNLQVNVKGDAGGSFGRNAIDSQFVIEGKGDNYFAAWANRCSFYVRGSVGHQSCHDIKESIVMIEGDAEYLCGKKAEDSTIIVRGKVDREFGVEAENCIFVLLSTADPEGLGERSMGCTYKTNNHETLDRLKSSVPTVSGDSDVIGSSGNKIIFIHKDGTEEEIERNEHVKYGVTTRYC